MSPERAVTPEEEVFTPKMSVPGSPVAGTPISEAHSPISILLAVAQNQIKSGDDDLTSLSWLQEKDLLKDMNLINPSPSSSMASTPIKTEPVLLLESPTSDYLDDSLISTPESSSSSSMHSPVIQNSSTYNKHPHNVQYNPFVHTTNKPPYSFSCLIFMAIEDSDQKALPVKEIYAWIMEHFPYFQNAPTGWKNSVRHNLSLNKCFQKVEKAPNLGKGSLWTVDQQYRPNLLQALTRSPFHPCSTLSPGPYYNIESKQSHEKNSSVSRLPNPELFPFLSTEMNKLVKTEVTSDDSLDAVDAAAVMLSLRNGPRVRQRKQSHQIITTSPSQDHTYSAADTVNGSPDEAFESDDDRVPKNSICRKINFDEEEIRRIKEGAETLLNLAGILTKKRKSSQSSDGESKRTRKTESLSDDEKPTHFRPRLLRKKGKKIINNNNTIQKDDEWVRHRRELEIQSSNSR